LIQNKFSNIYLIKNRQKWRFFVSKSGKIKKLSTIRQNRLNPFAVRAFRCFFALFFLSPYPLAFGLFLRGLFRGFGVVVFFGIF